MCENRLMIAAAGSGKTTYIVNKALDLAEIDSEDKILITTYTRLNTKQIRRKIDAEAIRRNCKTSTVDKIVVQEWFTFLLKEGVRPYKALMNPALKYKKVGFCLTSSRSGKKPFLLPNGSPCYYGEEDFFKFYFAKGLNIYSDKISKFIFELNKKVNGLVFDRLSRMYKHIFIDEIQDLAGWDLEIIKLLLESKMDTLLVGDPRQTIYLTNNADKYKKYRSGKIYEFIKNECNKIKVNFDFETLNKSHRLNKETSIFSSGLYPDYPATDTCECCEKLRALSNMHEGVFIIRTTDIVDYIEKYEKDQIQILRYENAVYPELNVGISKGSTFQRVLLYPTSTVMQFLKKGILFRQKDGKKVEMFDIAKFYVAVTRARHSVAIVYDYKASDTFIGGIKKYIKS